MAAFWVVDWEDEGRREMAFEVGSRWRGYSLKISISEAILRVGGTVVVLNLLGWRYDLDSGDGELVSAELNIVAGGEWRAGDLGGISIAELRVLPEV
jgi:hypothetical protein